MVQSLGVKSSLYYLWLSEKQAGPYSLEQVAGMWSLGTITAETLWWNEESGEWEQIATLEVRAGLAKVCAVQAEIRAGAMEAEDDLQSAREALRAAKLLTFSSAFVLLVVAVGAGMFLWPDGSKQGRVGASEAQPVATNSVTRQTNSPAELILKAELSLQQKDFEGATDFLNTVPSEFPQSEEAEIVAKIKKVLRKSDEIATPLNSEEGERIGKLFEAFEALQDAYQLIGRAQRRNLEVIF